MDFIKNLLFPQPPSENDIIIYALSKIELPYKSDHIKESLQKKYRNLQQVEISQLEDKVVEIFTFCMNVESYGAYYEKVKNRYPFLSNKVLGSLRGKAFLVQERSFPKFE